jgi:uroporphyrin-III C-methyltransferase/precorrin-2 dehydrogenase/sirohydrochlorin ferrochelatase
MGAPSYPLVLDVAGRRVVVIGGGPVAARRAGGLIEAGADVLVVAPYLCEPLAELVAGGRAQWRPREYGAGDLDGAWLAHTATGDPDVDGLVAADAEAARVWCVRADDATSSMAWTPAVARVGDVLVAVAGGGDPGRAVKLRNAIQAALETGAGLRMERKDRPSVDQQLPLRRTRARAGEGRVALVGGGPGDPGLITTRGRVLLAGADVVVVDRLAPRTLLDTLDPDVEVIDVGKTPGHHPVSQDEINRLLVEHAQAGRRVVRLKGGDPFVLGRGGEELAFCRAAGVPVEVVPGVTSAVSVPAAAGIPVTHRGLARQFTVVSGHEGLDWPSLASVEGTLVLLMGVSRLADAAMQLIAHGKDADTSAAVIEDGYGPRQRLTTGTLATIADVAAERDVRPPAVIVIGDVVQLAIPVMPWLGASSPLPRRSRPLAS